jgi:hypothetical protein
MGKSCTQCEKEKPVKEFIKIPTGRHSMCDPCRKAYQRAYNMKRKKMNNQKLW